MLIVAIVALTIGGAADIVSGAFRTSILQSAATDEMVGRLQGVFLVVVVGGPGSPTLLTARRLPALGLPLPPLVAVCSWSF